MIRQKGAIMIPSINKIMMCKPILVFTKNKYNFLRHRDVLYHIFQEKIIRKISPYCLNFSNSKDTGEKKLIPPNDFFPTEPTEDEKETSEIMEKVFKDLYPPDEKEAESDKSDRDSDMSNNEKP